MENQDGKKKVSGFLSISISVPIEVTIGEVNESTSEANFWIRMNTPKMHHSFYLVDSSMKDAPTELICSIQDAALIDALERSKEIVEEHIESNHDIGPLEELPDKKMMS